MICVFAYIALAGSQSQALDLSALGMSAVRVPESDLAQELRLQTGGAPILSNDGRFLSLEFGASDLYQYRLPGGQRSRGAKRARFLHWEPARRPPLVGLGPQLEQFLNSPGRSKGAKQSECDFLAWRDEVHALCAGTVGLARTGFSLIAGELDFTERTAQQNYAWMVHATSDPYIRPVAGAWTASGWSVITFENLDKRKVTARLYQGARRRPMKQVALVSMTVPGQERQSPGANAEDGLVGLAGATRTYIWDRAGKRTEYNNPTPTMDTKGLYPMRRGVIWEARTRVYGSILYLRDRKRVIHQVANTHVVGHSSNYQYWLIERVGDHSYWLAHFEQS